MPTPKSSYVKISSSESGGAAIVGPRQIWVRWKFANERLGVGPRWPW